MNRYKLALLLAATLTASNFFFQAVVSQEWGKAFDRSMSQTAAVLVMAWWVGVFGEDR